VDDPKTNPEIHDLIRRMSSANPLWGAPRIHGELLKLGIEVSQATVGRYLPRRPKTPSPTWRSFLHNHVRDTVAIDLFVVATATFRILYTLIVLDQDRRKIIHLGVAENPTQVWLSYQITDAFPWDTAPRYLLRDRGASYGPAFGARVKGMGAEEVAPRAPWQNPYAERIIGSNERTSIEFCLVLSLNKDCPNSRDVQPPSAGKIVAFPEAGGLHHRYERRAARATATIDRAVPSATSAPFHSLRRQRLYPISGKDRSLFLV
jgi:putative transposase